VQRKKKYLPSNLGSLNYLINTYEYSDKKFYSDYDLFIFSNSFVSLDELFIAFSCRYFLIKGVICMNRSIFNDKFAFIDGYITSADTDGIYKLLLNGFIVVFLGTHDFIHSYQKLSLAFLSIENCQIYSLLFKQTNSIIKRF
jgi:hypothetical protein